MPVELTYLNVGMGVDLSIRDLPEHVTNATAYEGSIEWDTIKPDGTPEKQLDLSPLAELGWRSKALEDLVGTMAVFRMRLK